MACCAHPQKGISKHDTMDWTGVSLSPYICLRGSPAELCLKQLRLGICVLIMLIVMTFFIFEKPVVGFQAKHAIFYTWHFSTRSCLHLLFSQAILPPPIPKVGEGQIRGSCNIYSEMESLEPRVCLQTKVSVQLLSGFAKRPVRNQVCA